jgi:hypothetical protein
MAEPDHTVLAHPSGLLIAPITHLSGYPPASLVTGEKTQLGINSATAEVEEIKLVVQLLLDGSEGVSEVLSNDALVQRHVLQLPAAAHGSRLVSKHFLDQCADMRRPKPNG